jgi:hypothetical protein
MICPRCGAENQPTAKICRMCATPLDGAAQKANMAQPGAGNRPGNSPAAFSPGPGEILCSTCKAVNDATWAYCQQCGSQLHKAGVQQAAPMPAPAPIPPPIQNRPGSAPAPVSVRPPAPPAPPATIKASPPIIPVAVTPQPPPHNDEGLSGAILNCTSCGRINTPGSSFCATCGAPLPAEQPEPAPTPAPRPALTGTPKLRLIQEGGGEGEVYRLETEETVIGRNSGDIRFPHDGYMSGRHARLVRRGERYILVDENSRNGTFKRIDGEVELRAGDIILIGKQLFRFEL